MKKSVVLLTGGSGYIGKNILEHLGDKYIIIAPSHEQLELSNTDMVEVYLRNHPVNVIIHTANVGGNLAESDVPSVAAYNLRIFFNLVRNTKYYKKFIYLGSGAQYGKQLSISRVKETDLETRLPIDEFGLYKYICARYIEDSHQPLLNLVLFGIYGKYEPYQFRFISNALCRSLFNMPITINQNALFDYLWIDDFMSILDYFLSHNSKYRTYNIGTGKSRDLLSIAEEIRQIVGNNSPIYVKKSGMKEEYTCDIGRLKKEVTPLHFTDFKQTLQNLLQYYKTNRNTLDKTSLI